MGVFGAIGGALIQSRSASKAAKAQQAAANRDIAYQEETRDMIRGDLAPFRESGVLAQNALMSMLGLGSAPVIGGTAPEIETFQMGGTPSPAPRFGPGRMGEEARMRGAAPAAAPMTTGYRVNGQTFGSLADAQAFANANKTGGQAWSWQADPGYQFRLGEGMNALESSRAARGGLYSGAAMKDAMTLGQNMASQEFGNIYNRIAGAANTGMSAAQMSGNAAQNTAGAVSNALAGIGNAQAAGAIGQGNAINTGIGNALGAWQYQRQMGGMNGNGAWANPLFGGPGLGGFV